MGHIAKTCTLSGERGAPFRPCQLGHDAQLQPPTMAGAMPKGRGDLVGGAKKLAQGVMAGPLVQSPAAR